MSPLTKLFELLSDEIDKVQRHINVSLPDKAHNSAIECRLILSQILRQLNFIKTARKLGLDFWS